VQLPESAEQVCKLYPGSAQSNCWKLFKRAAEGEAKAIYDIAVSVQSRPLEAMTDWQQYNLQDLARREIEARWLRIAVGQGYLDGAYFLAKTIHTAFSIASQRTPPDFVQPGPELLRSALKVGTPGEALGAARLCSASPGCMSILSTFYSEGFGGTRDLQLAIEWRANAARTYASLGNRDLAVGEFRSLSILAPTHPLTSTVREQLFPANTADAEAPKMEKAEPDGRSTEDLEIIEPEDLILRFGAMATRLGDDGKTRFVSRSETVAVDRLTHLERIIANLPKRLEVMQLCEQMRGMTKAKLIADSGLAIDVASVNYGYRGPIIACALKFMRENKVGTQLLFIKKRGDTVFMVAFVD
jgi:hypothetical protein